MTTSPFELLAALLFAAVSNGATPRNDVEALVLAPEENASHELEAWLDAHRSEPALEETLLAAGFKVLAPSGKCRNYGYTRRIAETIDRGADVTLCEGRGAFVMRFDMAPGPWLAPAPGQPAVIAPGAPRP